MKKVSRKATTGRIEAGGRAENSGTYSAETGANPDATTSKATSHRARTAKTGTFVRVPFGRREVDAVVVEGRRGRIEVEINVQGADPVRTSYAPSEITSYDREQTTKTSRGSVMPNDNERHVVPNDKGGWDVKAPGATRASAHEKTQSAAEQRAKEIVKNAGGGEVRIHGRDGKIRDSDTVKPGHDSSSIKDRKH